MSQFPRRERDFFGHIHGWPERPDPEDDDILERLQEKVEGSLWRRKTPEVSRVVIGIRERRDRVCR